MLKEIFRTELIQYRKVGDKTLGGGDSVPSSAWTAEHGSYGETLETFGMLGMALVPDAGSNENSIMLHGTPATYGRVGVDFRGWRFHAQTGRLIQAYNFFGSTESGYMEAPSFLSIRDVVRARSGKLWGWNWAGGVAYGLSYGAGATYLSGDAPTTKGSFWTITADRIDYRFWKVIGDPTYLWSQSSHAIDDMVAGGGRYLDTYGAEGREYLVVFNWTTGQEMYRLHMATTVVQLALEDDSHVYALLTNRTVVLVDYIRGEILGAAKLPPLVKGNPYGGDSGLDTIFDGIRMAWDHQHKRLLFVENSPDNPDGSSTVRVRGYRLVPEPVRITRPIPLKVPRQGRTVPVLVQCVDDMNQGVGGHVVEAAVSGSGSLIGLPITDGRGNALIQVACEGSPLFVSSPDPSFDWAGTGSPEGGSPAGSSPHTGLVEVFATVKVPQVDPADIPVSGGTTPPGGAPGEPGSGIDPGTNLPATAPNMMYIIENLYATGKYDISGVKSLSPNGRGALCEASVVAMHDIDPRFGHLDKIDGTGPLPNRYNGHAVDALTFKCDDGVTGEIYDIFLGSDAGAIGWRMDSRDAHGLDVWKYPA